MHGRAERFKREAKSLKNFGVIKFAHQNSIPCRNTLHVRDYVGGKENQSMGR